MGEVTIDFVARDQPHGGWALVLVEEGPWPKREIPSHLLRVQDRLYGCLDAAVDGLVARQFPASVGHPLLIRLDAYDVPRAELTEFFERFSSAVPLLPDYGEAIRQCTHYPGIAFELAISGSRNAM